jgi:transcriptional regulator with AAA-type ATPase domain
MARSRRISAADREFCVRAAGVAFANPFGDEFVKSYPAVVGECGSRVDRMEKGGVANLAAYRGKELEVMRVVLLFDAYQRFRERLDEAVVEQIDRGDTPMPIRFGKEALALLVHRGFRADEAVRAFGLFFQIRRAYHFIDAGLVGVSACMREFRRRLWNNVFTHDIACYERFLLDRMEDFSTLLLGETGTGKGTAALAIGRSGYIPYDEKKQCFAESFMRGFVSLNLSQFPETLIESELFGHRKGAFTGAVEAHHGVLVRCSPYGAIFLDEIGEVPPPVQIKLLRVLQERVFSPVGSHETLRFRGRVIAATNKPLSELRNAGGFRDDFYYRLCSDTITVPPLRERIREDVRELEALLGHIVRRVAADSAGELLPMIRSGLAPLLKDGYPWPGNVRELEQAVRRIVLTRSYTVPRDEPSTDRAAKLAADVSAGSLDADTLLSAYCALLYERTGNIEEVARRTALDRRTVKRYLGQARASGL